MKEIKGETRKIYRTFLPFCRRTIIPMVSSSFVRAGFFLHSKNLLGHVAVDATKILERIEISEFAVEEAFMHPK
jgi:hypothetical protein